MARLSTLVARTPSIMANSQGYPESRNRRMTARPPYPCLLTIPSHSSVTNHQNLSASRAGSDASSFYFHPHSQSHSHMIQPCILDRIWPSPCRRWHHPSACTTAASRSITHSRSHSHMIQPYNHAHPGFGPLCVSSVAPPISLHNRSFKVHQ